MRLLPAVALLILAAASARPACAQVMINGADAGTTYSVPAGGVTATQDEEVGYTADGTINQTQGTNDASAYQVYIGKDLGLGYVTGTYNLGGGVLQAAGEQVGLDSGEGIFQQSGGTNDVTNLSVIGQFGAIQTVSSGSYALAGGTLNATNIAIGGDVRDSATFAFNGGTANFNTLTLGAGGAVSASGNEVLDSAANFAAGNQNYSVNQSAGSNTVATGALELGASGTTLGVPGAPGSPSGSLFAPNSGTYTQSGGSVAADAETIGLAGTGSYTQSAGSNTVAAPPGGSATVTLSDGSSQAAGSLVLGAAATASGTYTLQTGSLSAASEVVGGSGTGRFVQSGGTNSATALTLAQNSGASGSYDLSGGTLAAAGVTVNAGGGFTFDGGSLTSDSFRISGGAVSASGDETITAVASGDTVSMLQTGGSNTISNGTLMVGANGGAATTYILNGGTVSALNESVAAGNNSFSQYNGTNTVAALSVGGNGGSSGYLLAGGTLTAGSIAVTSTGDFTLAAGEAADVGLLSIAGNVVAHGNEALDSAGQTHSSYSVSQIGGSNSAFGAIELGAAAGNTGSYSLSGGTVAAQAEVIGLAGAADFTQTGGDNALTGTSGAPPVTLSSGDSVAQGTVTIGFKPGSAGTYALQGGNFNLTGATEVTAYGVFDLSGGKAGAITNDGSFSETAGGTVDSLTNNASASVGGTLMVATTLTSNGLLDLAGGTISTAGGLANTGTISGNGTIGGAGGFTNSGTLVQSGGGLTVSATGSNDNIGEIDLLGGTSAPLQLAAGTTLANDGVIKLNDGVISGAGVLDNTSGLIGGTGRISVSTFKNGGTLTADAGLTSVSGTFLNHGVIEMTGTSALLSGGILTNYGTIEGAGRINNSLGDLGGTIQAIGGTLVLGGPVTTVRGTTFLTATGTKILASGGMSGNVGTISLAGGSFDTNGGALANSGTISGYGTFNSGGLSNNGTMLVAGGTATINGAVTNSAGGTITVDRAVAVFNGPVTNNGTVRTILGTATYAGTFTNNGTVISDPSTQTFTGDLVEGSTGVIQAAAGDRYIVEGGFLNHSTQNTAWNTADAMLEFAAGTSSTHSLLLNGLDRGATGAGYLDNFAWGDVAIDTGQSLLLGDGITSSNVAFYIYSLGGALISGSDITNITGNGFDIYYDPFAAGNAYLAGRTYSLTGGGSLIADSAAVPEPGTLSLLAAGLLGTAWFDLRDRARRAAKGTQRTQRRAC